MNNSSDSMHIGISSGAAIDLCGKDYTYKNNQGKFILTAFDGNTYVPLAGSSSGTLTWGSKNLAMQEDVVPRSGGAVMTGDVLARNVDDASLYLCGSASINTSSAICVYGNDFSAYNLYGVVRIFVRNTNLSQTHEMQIRPSGSWTWTGQAVQITSDQRLKQQINEIDDKLLDAWEDVTLCQFKYNDAVEQKGNQARLHTGYVVQQIDNACKSHNVDISEYGLYCHEEYPEETREVEHEDGTKTIEVVRPASEHYSLRYTETLVVECAYLRKKNKELENTVLNLQTEIADLKSVIAELKTTVQGNQKS